jgi:hypothetical protein
MRLSEILKDDKKKMIFFFQVLSIFFLVIGIGMLLNNKVSGVINIIFGIISFVTSIIIKRDKKTNIEVTPKEPEMSLYEKMDKLYDAVREGNKQLVKDMLWKGIDVNHEYFNGYTLFSLATQMRNRDIMKILIMYKADINKLHPILGKTPLTIAVVNNDIETVKFILNYNVDINIKREGGMTALEWSKALNHNEITELIEAYNNKN